MIGLNMPQRNPKTEFLYLSFRFLMPNTVTSLRNLDGSLKSDMNVFSERGAKISNKANPCYYPLNIILTVSKMIFISNRKDQLFT